MPPRRRQSAWGQVVQTSTDALSGLPDDVLNMIARFLVATPPDKLNSVVMGSCGVAHVYSLADVICAARAKHGSAAGLAAAREERAAAAAKRREASRDLGRAREEELRKALEPFSLYISSTMRDVSVIAHFLTRKKAARLSEVVEVARLVHFAQCRTKYSMLRNRVRAARYSEFKAAHPSRRTNDYSYWAWTSNPDAGWREQMSEEEDMDLLHLALQRWAEEKGGAEAALKLAEVPEDLRDRIKKGLGQGLTTQVRVWEAAGSGYSGHGYSGSGYVDDEEYYSDCCCC